MKTFTFALTKGGTGKTSCSVSVAVALAEMGKKVLLMDADPQGNATTWLGIEEISVELSDVLMSEKDKEVKVQDAILKTQIPNLSILPTASLNSSLRLYSKTKANTQPFIIRHLKRELKDEFDYLIIDTSPSLGALEESCLVASDETVTVMDIDEFSTDGLIIFMNNIESLHERLDTDKPKMNKIILNRRDKRLSQQNEYVDKIMNSSDCKFYVIPIDQTFKKAQAVHVPVQFLSELKTETDSVIKSIAMDIIQENNQE